MKKGSNNKWVRAAIPALLLHCSIGTVYCWSVFSQEVADYIGKSKSAVEWAFSFAIFFLGMSAAFLGNVVEKDIHKSSLIATICFTIGMIGTGVSIMMKSLVGIYLFYGCIMGIGLGTGYLSPVKTLMLWFKDKKGLATGLAVAGFGAAKAIASPIMQAILSKFTVDGVANPAPMFFIMGAVYFVMMFIGHLLLKKPEGWVEEHDDEGGLGAFFKALGSNIKMAFTNKTFIGIWLMFYINITCGLALISQEKPILKTMGLSLAVISVLSSVTAIANAAGRLGFSAAADGLKDRNTIYKVIFLLSIVFTGATILTGGITNKIVWLCVALLIMVNAGYGGGFSNVPTLLSDHFGMKTISAIHGLCLSAWAFAGLTGNQLATYIVNHFGTFEDVTLADGNVVSCNPVGYQTVLYVTLVLYIIAAIICFTMIGKKKENPVEE